MLRIIALSLLFGAFFSSAASASSISVGSGVLTYTAAPGEDNSVLVSPSPYDTTCGPVATPCVTVSDSARMTQASGGCVVVSSGIFGDAAACPMPQYVVASLGDRDDSYWDWDGDSRIDAGAGNDNPIYGEGGDDEISGGPGSDLLIGNDGDDTIDGGAGDDYFDGIHTGFPDEAWTHGADRYRGGGGIDSVTYESRTEDLSLSPDGVANDGAAGEGDDIGADIRIVYAGVGNDTM